MYNETIGGDVYATRDGSSPPRGGYNDGGATSTRGFPRAADAFGGIVCLLLKLQLQRGYVTTGGGVLMMTHAMV